jgi:hypothetical protein
VADNKPIIVPTCNTDVCSGLCKSLTQDHSRSNAQTYMGNDCGNDFGLRAHVNSSQALSNAMGHCTGQPFVKQILPQGSSTHGWGIQKCTLASPLQRKSQRALHEGSNGLNYHISDIMHLPLQQRNRCVARYGSTSAQMLSSRDFALTDQKLHMDAGSTKSTLAAAALQSRCAVSASDNSFASAPVGTKSMTTCEQTEEVGPRPKSNIAKQQRSSLTTGLDTTHVLQLATPGKNLPDAEAIVRQGGINYNPGVFPVVVPTHSASMPWAQRNDGYGTSAGFNLTAADQSVVRNASLRIREEQKPDAIKHHALKQSWQLGGPLPGQVAKKQSASIGTQVGIARVDARMEMSSKESDTLKDASLIASNCGCIVLNAGSSLVISSGPPLSGNHLGNQGLRVISCSPAAYLEPQGAHNTVQGVVSACCAKERTTMSENSTQHRLLKNGWVNSDCMQTPMFREHMQTTKQIPLSSSPPVCPDTLPNVSLAPALQDFTQQAVKRFDMYTQTPQRRAHRKRKRGLELPPPTTHPWPCEHMTNMQGKLLEVHKIAAHPDKSCVPARQNEVLPAGKVEWKAATSSDLLPASCDDNLMQILSSPEVNSECTGSDSKDEQQGVQGCRSTMRQALEGGRQTAFDCTLTPSQCGPFPATSNDAGDVPSLFPSSPALKQKIPFCRLVPGTSPLANTAPLGPASVEQHLLTSIRGAQEKKILNSRQKLPAYLTTSQVHVTGTSPGHEQDLANQCSTLRQRATSDTPRFCAISPCIQRLASTCSAKKN